MAFSYSEINYSLPPIRYLGGRTCSCEQLPLAAVTTGEAIIGRTSLKYGPVVQDLSPNLSALRVNYCRRPSTDSLVAVEQPRLAIAAPQPAVVAQALPARIVRARSQELIAEPRVLAAAVPTNDGSIATSSNELRHQTVKLINDGTGLKTEVTNHITKVNDIHHYRVEHVKGETREFNNFKETRTVEPSKCLRA